MLRPDGVQRIPSMSSDARVHVYRRILRADFPNITVDAYVVITERYLIVFDTLLCPADVALMLEGEREALSGRQLLVVNSHADWDHCWGNAYFAQAPTVSIIAHENARQRLRSTEAQTELADFQARNPLFQAVELLAPTITFSQSLIIDGGDLTIELHHAPGHRSDEIVAWIPERRLLLAFDAAEMPFPSIESPASAPLMLATLEQLIAFRPERVLSSHGGTTGPALLQANLEYLRDIEGRCQEVLMRGESPETDTRPGTEIIAYPYIDVATGLDKLEDSAYYQSTHEQNIQQILRWLRGL